MCKDGMVYYSFLKSYPVFFISGIYYHLWGLHPCFSDMYWLFIGYKPNGVTHFIHSKGYVL